MIITVNVLRRMKHLLQVVHLCGLTPVTKLQNKQKLVITFDGKTV